MNRYKIIQVAKGALVFQCQDCGSLIFERSVHETWHALQDVAISLILQDLERSAE